MIIEDAERLLKSKRNIKNLKGKEMDELLKMPLGQLISSILGFAWLVQPKRHHYHVKLKFRIKDPTPLTNLNPTEISLKKGYLSALSDPLKSCL